MCSPSAPAAPDYTGAANAQGAANIAAAQTTTQLNRPNQITPWGTQTWYQGPQGAAAPGGSGGPTQGGGAGGPGYQTGWTPGNPGKFFGGTGGTTPAPGSSGSYSSTGGYSPANDWTSVTTLSPVEQQLFDTQNQISQGLGNQAQANLGQVTSAESTPFSMGGIKPINYGTQSSDLGGLQQKATDAAMARQNTQLDQQQEQLTAQLANQGITPGSDAYNRAMQPLQQARVDATNQSFLTGTQYENQLFNQGQSAAQLSNQAGQQALGQEITARTEPLNELNALRSGAQVQAPQFPQYNSASVQAAPIFGATQAQGAYNLQNYANQVGQSNGMLGGLFSLGGSMMGAAGQAGGFSNLFSSDRRLKRNLCRLGKTPRGTPLYSFDYVWGEPAIGVMSDEAPPRAVVRGASGFDMVDYSQV
jgi:hypothetical protein